MLTNMSSKERVLTAFASQQSDLGKAYGAVIMVHTCGSSSWAYEDFVEMGIKVVDTLQPEAVNMSPSYLKRIFGERLAFHGCISTAGPVSSGTVEETVACCFSAMEMIFSQAQRLKTG